MTRSTAAFAVVAGVGLGGPAAEKTPDGSTEIYSGPEQPHGVPRGNWIQTVAGKGWFQMIRLNDRVDP